MSGEKNNKKEINSGVEFFYKLSLNPEFQKDIIVARKELALPPKGFMNPETRQKLWIEWKNANWFEFLGVELHLKQKYNIPIPYMEFIDDYVFFGKPVNAPKAKSPVARIISYTPTGFEDIEKLYDSMGEPYVKLIIFQNATTKKKLKDFIDKNWREIELSLNINIHKPTKVKEKIYKNRDNTIREVWRLPIEKLREQVKVEGKELMARESLVAEIIFAKELSPKLLANGTIKRIANEKNVRDKI